MSNLTPRDNAQVARERAVPNVSRQFTITLSGSTPGSVQLPEDVKTAVLKVIGADVQFWPSYNDGITDKLAGLDVTSSAANAGTNNTIKDVAAGETFQEAQEQEFNKINAVITSGSGSATVRVYPGYGEPNGI